MLLEELDTIKQAIGNEIEGYEFYRMAAHQTKDSGSKEALLLLADEELKHAEYLKMLFNHMKNEASDAFNFAFLSEPPSPNIYNWNKVEKEALSLAMSVFGIGMQMERDSITFYEKAKENATLKEIKKVYELLIAWENVHLEQFSQQYKIHKEEWWDEQGFEPF